MSNDEVSIIIQSTKTLLYSGGKHQVKKYGEDNFDVPIGCYDIAEVCEFVGTYLLNQLKIVITKENMTLYRDDGLDIFEVMPGSENGKKKNLSR